MSRVSLHDIAPRLAVARDLRRWEVDTTGDYPGRDFCRILDHEHTTGVCRHCGGADDRYVVRDVILVGPNKGLHCRVWWQRCRRCGHGAFSNYRCPW